MNLEQNIKNTVELNGGQVAVRLNKVLVVDDNIINRQLLSRIIRDEYEPIEAENGKVALEILEKESQRIAAVLLDIMMPVMDGYEFLEQVRANASISNIPVIVTTQKDDQQSEIRALTSGASDFLSKPYKPEIIKHRLTNLVKLRENAAIINAIERDSLTGLYNKDAFYQKATALLMENPAVNYDIVAFDIERFKLVNDAYGLAEGDKLLKYIADVVLAEFREHGGICARITGDKFIVIYPRIRYIERMLAQIKKFDDEYPLGIKLRLKMGIYHIDDSTIPVTLMCDRARLAVKTIKGKYDEYYTVYNDTIRIKLLREQQMLDDMDTAITQDQFEIYFQPKYDLDSEKIVGAEALSRWNHPTLGFLMPEDFLQVFEKNGYISRFDMHIWDKVCATIAAWIKRCGKYVPVSVNISRVDIYNYNLPGILLQTVEKYGLTPHHLHLEITEPAYSENQNQLIEVVGSLRKLGFMVEMDNFGSGYSSLNMLSQLPIDVLKLNMKYIQSEATQDSSRNILSFIVSLARWIDLLIVAENVETREQVDLLRNMDCNYVQGYYYARPMPLAEFEKLLFNSEITTPMCINDIKREKGAITVKNANHQQVMLIVDDIKLNRTILSEIFSPTYSIVEADDGEVAYNYIRENYENIAIVMLDIVMPGMDGFEVLRKLRGNKLLRDLPVIVTSQAGETSEAKALELGASDFVAKPYNADVAIHRVRNVMAHSKVVTLERERTLIMEMQRIERESKKDSMTGLYNRAELMAQVSDYFKDDPNAPGVFIILDVDNFKIVNDTLSHIKGDETILRVAGILRECFREDDIICRMGGDEFAIFIKAAMSGHDINLRLAMLNKKLSFNVADLSLTCSIGICEAPKYGNSYIKLYENADTALLTAKRLGKNRYEIYGDNTHDHLPIMFRSMDWLLEESSEAVFVCDVENYTILYSNSAVSKMLKNKTDLADKKCYEAIWGRTEPCEKCQGICSGGNDSADYDMEVEHGERYYAIKSKLIDWGGRQARLHFIHDNTQRVRLKNELIQSAENLEQMLKKVPIGLVKCKVDSRMEIAEANNSFYQIIGYTKTQFEQERGNSLAAIIRQDYLARALAEMNGNGEITGVTEIQQCFIARDGSEILVKCTRVCIADADGQLYFYFTFDKVRE